MNKFVLIAIAIVVLAGAAMSGLFSLRPNKDQDYKAVSPTAACVDFDPPSTSNTVIFNSVQYDLIKKDAHIIEAYKFQEMSLIGQTPDGKNVYTEGGNYFGQNLTQELIFVIQNSVKPYESPYIFDIYLKDGVPIPDYIKNCKSTGGTLSVSVGNSTVFPPSAFNKTQIQGLLDESVAAAYVYNGNKTTLSFVTGLAGTKLVGVLPFSGQNYNLHFHLGTIYLVNNTDAYEYLPSNTPIEELDNGGKALQLQKVTFVQTASYSWWTPSCKPAIYLYPKNSQNVNVKVNTTGYFTLTIPNYSPNGWSVLANPNGEIKVENTIYPYLYYESQVPDSKVQVPNKGYIVTKGELPGLFNSLFPKLGLLSNEAKEFKDYWQKALPLSSYYFVGVMDKQAIDTAEPLDINPKPDTIIRVRLYFKLLDKSVNVVAPEILTPKRNGFTVVEWGGMVKTDKNNSFTCSQ